MIYKKVGTYYELRFVVNNTTPKNTTNLCNDSRLNIDLVEKLMICKIYYFDGYQIIKHETRTTHNYNNMHLFITYTNFNINYLFIGMYLFL